jgi:hypothetical protein
MAVGETESGEDDGSASWSASPLKWWCVVVVAMGEGFGADWRLPSGGSPFMEYDDENGCDGGNVDVDDEDEDVVVVVAVESVVNGGGC